MFFELGNTRYLNNTVIIADEVGEESSALLCRTNNSNCCSSSSLSFRGEFYYPNNSVVTTRGSNPSFYRNRGTGFIRLNRESSTDIPVGEYRCEIPDDSGRRQRLFINVGKLILSNRHHCSDIVFTSVKSETCPATVPPPTCPTTPTPATPCPPCMECPPTQPPSPCPPPVTCPPTQPPSQCPPTVTCPPPVTCPPTGILHPV